MSLLSDSLLQPAANEGLRDVFVPFTAFVRIVPIRGKRFETVRDMEKIANEVELALEDLCGATDAWAFDFAKPVAFTPQFGDKTARLTIHGNACVRSSFTKTPDGTQLVVSDGEKSGYSAANASNRTPDPDTDQVCRELKAAIESLTGLEIYRMEVAGYIYGVGGTTFPR